MTLTDLLLWLGLATAGIVACTATVGVIRWLFVRADARTYLAPAVDRMVWLTLADDVVAELAPAVNDTPVADDSSAWALTALADARKAAIDTYATLGEFARRVPTGHAWIGMEVEASTELRRLAVAA